MLIMIPQFGVKEEESIRMSSAPPQPMEGLHEGGPPPFLTKTYDIVDDSNTAHIVSWSTEGYSFVVWDPHSFSTTILPKYFKHNNFSSFVRQLNTYGFRKIDPDKWEFANEGFIRGHRHLLKNIKRKRATQPIAVKPSTDPCVELGSYELDEEVNRLKCDKQVLLMEVVKLRQQRQTTRAYIQAMEQRLQQTEMKQQQMMAFLARAIQNPVFVQQLLQQSEKRKELKEDISRKRRRPIDQAPGGVYNGGSNQLGQAENPIKSEPMEFGDYDAKVSELEVLALEMQGFHRVIDSEEEFNDLETQGTGGRELDEGFLEELLNERFEEESETSCGECDGYKDIMFLADQLG